MSLKEKLEVLKTLDSEVLDLTGEDGLAGEIEAADTYNSEIYAAMARLDDYSASYTCYHGHRHPSRIPCSSENTSREVAETINKAL
jgi:hypothetical protein